MDVIRSLLYPKPAAGLPAKSRTASAEAPDQRLACEIRNALAHTGYFELRRIDIAVNRFGKVLLMGDVPSYFLKQVAQTAVLAVDGVKTVENLLEVNRT